MATKNKPTPKPKKPAAKAAPKHKPAPKKAAPAKTSSAVKKPAPTKKPAPAKKIAAKKPTAKPVAPAKKPLVAAKGQKVVTKVAAKPPVPLTGFLAKQRQRLLNLKDTLLDSMNGVAKDSLRSRAEGSEASAFGMHQADAGSDAYDRDFALSLLSQEQDSLYEIDEALKRVSAGTYGICEMSNKPIPHPRLEVLPFTRYTVDCQAELEKRNRYSKVRQPVTSLFGLNDDEGGEGEDEDSSNDSKD
jgi:RNA polymerase-binding transcription factor DksA